jgi:hypothetical protein
VLFGRIQVCVSFVNDIDLVHYVVLYVRCHKLQGSPFCLS